MVQTIENHPFIFRRANLLQKSGIPDYKGKNSKRYGDINVFNGDWFGKNFRICLSE